MKALTVKEIKRQLEGWPDDWKVEFSGLTLHQLKKRDEEMVNVEFNEMVRVIELKPSKPGTPLPRRQ